MTDATVDTTEAQAFVELASKIAREAGATLGDEFGNDLKVNEAYQHDLKIQLDEDTQELIEKRILEVYPEHSILGEEGGEGTDGVGYEWIVDPIDGTVNLAYGIPHFCVSIALRKEGMIVAGVIYDPMRDELFSAAKGCGAFCNGNKISVSQRTDLKEAILSLGFSKKPETVQRCLGLYQYYGPRTRKMRAMGSAALDMAYISAGRYDAYIEQGIKIWDVAAGQVLLEEAGGKVVLTPLDERFHYHICASNGKIDFPEV